MKYEALKNTDFFSFFNFQESEFFNLSFKGICLKPGGFQEYIDLILCLDNEEEIVQAFLYLDREWIGNEASINPFGKDISKSFIDALYPKDLNDEFKPSLITSLWNLKGTKDTIICLDKVIQAWENSDSQVKAFLDAYRGSLKEVSKKNNDNVEIRMKNLIENGKNRLLITIIFPR
ncbi:MAG: hypothetical protein JW891_00510 [Candidatus Lokiarchaeota archaeon]|nr:hypothetical protein [Candidatus Lokiarchaeota archaeon]